MNKTKLIALCGACCAVAVVCIVALSYVKWVALALAVVAAVVTCCPQMVDGKYVWYSVAIYLIAVVVGAFVSNPTYLAPVALYAMPCCIWKLHCKHRQSLHPTTWKGLKWIGSVLLALVALTATCLLIWWLCPAVWQAWMQHKQYLWLAALIVPAGVVAYDKLLDGAIFVVQRAIVKSKFGR